MASTDLYIAKAAHAKVAHGFDPEDNTVVRHCAMCFAGEVQYLTDTGYKNFRDTVGTTQMVLTNDGFDRHSGRWSPAEIKSFGCQALYEIVLTRNKQKKIIRATANHEWFVKATAPCEHVGKKISQDQADEIRRLYNEGGVSQSLLGERFGISQPGISSIVRGINWSADRKAARDVYEGQSKSLRAVHRLVQTIDLCKGDRLAYLLPEPYAKIKEIQPASEWIARGLMFGDGTTPRESHFSTSINLWGEKDLQLAWVFPQGNEYRRDMITPNGVKGLKISHIPGEWKTPPDLDEPPEHLLGWLAGYIAADGTVNKSGLVSLDSAVKANLELAQAVATRLGISCNPIISKLRKGCYGRGVLHERAIATHGKCNLEKASMLHRFSFVSSTVPSSMIVTDEHSVRFHRRSTPWERLSWTVDEVRPTGVEEEVFCAVVPETGSFVLDGGIWTHNCGSGSIWGRSDGSISCDFCGTVFSVQIQPSYPQMAQNIDGSDLDPTTGEVLPETGEQSGMLGDNEDVDEDAPEEGSPEDEEDQGKESGFPQRTSRKGPPSVVFTDKGSVLPIDDMINYLAFRHSSDRALTAQAVRKFNESR